MSAAATASQAEHKNARRLIELIEEFRKLDLEMQAQTMVTFLHVAAKPGITIKELAAITGTSSSSSSRNVAVLGKVHRKGLPGHDVVETYEDAEDRRTKRCQLTHKGRMVFSSLLDTLTA